MTVCFRVTLCWGQAYGVNNTVDAQDDDGGDDEDKDNKESCTHS